MKNINQIYVDLLRKVITKGKLTFPRGFTCKELDGFQVKLDMNEPELTLAGRGCNRNFMAAEFLWILAGRNDLAFVERFNSQMANFSDDGKSLYGAYGQGIGEQLKFCMKTLKEDESSRQAVMTFWKPNPSKSKDIPCTIGLHFMVRDGKLNCYSHMRSNDLWLGFPYDVYTFSMLSKFVADNLGFKLGYMVHNADSMHLYDEHLLKVKQALNGKATLKAKKATTANMFKLEKHSSAFDDFQQALSQNLDYILEGYSVDYYDFPLGIQDLLVLLDNAEMKRLK